MRSMGKARTRMIQTAAGHDFAQSSVLASSVSESDNSNHSLGDASLRDDAQSHDAPASGACATMELSVVRSRLVRVLRSARIAGPDAEDLVQQVLAELSGRETGLPTLASERLFAQAAWLAFHRSRTAYRSRAIRQERERASVVHSATHAPDLERLIIARDLLSFLEKMLGRLPERQRSVFVACVIQGMTHNEAATALGTPVGTVKSTLRAATRGLCAMMLAEISVPGGVSW